MKRILLLTAIFVLAWCCISNAGTAVTSVTEEKVWKDGVQYMRTFTSTTSVTAGNTTIFEIPMKYVSGQILEISFASETCTSWTVFLSSVDSLTTPAAGTFIAFSESAQIVGSRDYPAGRLYFNADSPQETTCYLTVIATTGNTGDWELIIKEPRK